MIYDTIVIGGGPAGMTAAIKAKETCEKAKILIIDRNKKLGKKLYATGNGRCNIANSALDLSSYHSFNEFFPYQIINTESYKKLKEFFMDLGVAIYDDGGYLYPQSMQASTVVWALSDRIKHLGIEIHTTEEAESVEPTDEMYGIVTDCAEYTARTVVAAPGSAAAPKLGGTESVYRLLENTDIRTIAPHPALCRLKTREDTSDLAGVRARCRVSLLCDGDVYDSESGEIQFADGWLSGIAVFNLSMQCIDLLNDGRTPVVEVTLVPEMDEDDVLGYLRKFRDSNPDRRLEAMFNGLVNEKIARFIINRLELKSVTAARLTDEELDRMVFEIKHMRFEISGHGGYDESQAACGGIDTRQLRPDSMEADGYKGLYVAGEYADVTGKCGGYNIMWAVMTGMRAGEAAGKRLTHDKNK